MRLDCASVGVSVPVHEKPYESPVQPSTVSSGMQVLAVVEKLTQQKRDAPLSPGVGSLQSSDGSMSVGKDVADVQEKPNEPPVQPVTVSSGVHVLDVGMVTQQKANVPVAVPGTLPPQSSVGSATSGPSVVGHV